ncbi:glycosyltransferase family 2 protein [Paenibacillus polymyxa]|uniref:glycosyltransferase family 2 protein n=1 Tax=Paenibacillus polymyxa TaxID=1406 RepID=UPI0002F4971E|nr:glycosyltransferase family 2 protein [Paenibacillus polymyxa]MBY7738394.1 glycosyltransferase family 2 protein [Paenibacillus polymyxa]MEE4578265.1 glycosyltransferase family 2 protein [Paenibacillus polymyxa]NMP12159.1 glycosyl transferase [Paenibacillus polymyxa]UQQ34913.1 glycosyltransferase family 2 protein [Paenibacillus polymyxa]
MVKKRVLVGSPIRQNPTILKEFLESLKRLEQETIELSYLFIDDNDNSLSSQILSEFSETTANVIVHKNNSEDCYIRNEISHSWNEQLVWKVARLKNIIIQIALEFNYDYLFFVDSDIVLHPKTVEQLKSREKEIISEIFWTKWQPEFPELPQVWLEDHYTMFYKQRNEQLTQEEALKRQEQFINQLKKPGIYEVGGLGACTLIRKSALEKGANFNEIKNLSFWGEDRHFCVRAAALGIGLFVDTHFPAYHIYRESDLEGVVKFKSSFNESIENKVMRVVSEGLSALGSFHYNLGYPVSWEQYFVREARVALQNEIQKQMNETIRNHTKVNAYVENLEYISYSADINLHRVKFTLHNYILQKGERIENHLNGVCDVFYNSEQCSIASFNIESEYEGKVYFPSHRKPEKLTLSMVIQNEGARFLKEVLESHVRYVDSAVIIDDGSTDDSVQICKTILRNIHLNIIENKSSKFSNEVELRKQQWEATIAEEPNWILNVDADELFEEKFSKEIHHLLQLEQYNTICFPLYDMWDDKHYREDEYWYAHKTHRPFIARYSPEVAYEWLEEKQHCGRFPKNILDIGQNLISNLKLKHLGWIREEDRLEKYNRYQLLDTNKTEFRTKHYDSILNVNPNLVAWED